jgi:ADP-ribosyl-[dinitrogen reductase] hydrolase
MTICPGKKGPSTMGDAWDRDMRTDMLHLKDEGVSTIVTLMEWDELGIYKAQSVKREAAKLGIQWLFFPFPDRGIPDFDQEEDWDNVSAKIHAALESSKTVLIHCLGGLGRTGTVASMILQDLGEDVEASILRVREARDGAIETASQEAFLRDYLSWKSQ